jgi:hypothetical protein
MTNEFKRVGGTVKEAASATQQSAGVIQTTLKSIADHFRKAKADAEAFAKTDLGVIRNELRGIADQWKYLSGAATLFIGKALHSAGAIEQLEIRFRGITGSQEKATALMGKIAEQADKLGAPVREAQTAALSLLPALKNNTQQLETYLGLTARLRVLNAGEGIAGASFAIREALSSGGTDLVSLAERFNISKVQLRKEIEAAKKSGLDETSAFAVALDKILNKMGVSQDVAEEMAQTFSVQVTGALQDFDQVAGEAFQPLLDGFVQGVKSARAFVNDLREAHPELLQLGAAGALVVAGISPISFAISKIIDGFKMMYDTAKTAFNFIKNNSQLLNSEAQSWRQAGLGTKLGIGAAAIGTGVVLGGQVTQGLANAGVQGGDFDRIRAGEDPLAIAGERLKQVIIIFVDGILYLGKQVGIGATWILNAVDQMVNVFKLAGTYVNEFFIRFTIALGDVIYGIGELLSGVMDTTGIKDAGQGLRNIGGEQFAKNLEERSRLETRLAQGLTIPQETMDNIEANYAELRQSVVGGLTNAFFPPVQEAAEQVSSWLQDTGEQVKEAADSAFSDDMVEAFSDFQGELKKIQDDAQKEREDELAKHETEKTKLEADQLKKRTEALEDFNRKQTERQTKLGWDISDLQVEFDKREKEERKKFRREELKRAADHALTLLQAAARLDGRAIYLEQQKYKQESKERENEGKRAKNERQKQLDDRIAQMQLEFQRESELQYNNFQNVELPRLQAQQTEELAAFEAAHQQRLTQITTQAAEQSAAAEAAFIDTFNKLVEAEGTHQGLMLGEQRKGQAAMEAELAAWWTKQKTMVAGGKTTTTTTGTGTGSSYGSNNPYTPVTPVTPFPNLPTSPNDQGFFPDLAGAASLAMTAANSMSTQSAAALNTVSGGGRGGALAGLQIGTFAPQIVLGDIGKRSDKEVEELIDRGIMKTLKKVAKGGRS